MRDMMILTITNDGDFLKLFRQQFQRQVAGGSPMIVASTIDEGCSLLKTVRPRLVVVHWTRDTGNYEQLDRLLWTTTVQARRIPVLVIAERYRTDQATMMYRLGVSEYISRTHHLEQLGSVFSAYLPSAPVMAQSIESSVASAQSSKAWSSNPKPGSIATQAV